MASDHAVVIGGSMSGLMAARVLSRHFERVTVIDRDALPPGVRHRLGVPQGRHGHGLLASGLSALKELFPDLERKLLSAGAVPGDVIGDVRWFQHGYYKAKFTSGFNGLLLSRSLLESAVRQLVTRLPNVTIVDHTHVRGVLTSADRWAFTGVRVQFPGRAAADVHASLVVDASGRGSASPAWLERLGYEPPRVDDVNIDLCYTTRTFSRRPEDLGGDIGAIIAPLPPDFRRVGFMLAMEGDRWIVTLGGWLGERAPGSLPDFVEFSRTLSQPDIYEVIRSATPLTDAAYHHFACNRRWRYERLDRFPRGFLVIGDALCSFNPLYGQGMSVAALEARALERCLDAGDSRLPLWKQFFREAAAVIDTPWTIAAGSDFAFAGVTGAKPAGTDVVNWYLERLHHAASADRTVCRQFFDVANLLAPAPTLFHPSTILRVARGCLFPKPPQQMPPLMPHEQTRRARTA
jgi:2-polyprenyl-6-methoxyphenol hydroxylase-like FAD-dependent oxidoreductase